MFPPLRKFQNPSAKLMNDPALASALPSLDLPVRGFLGDWLRRELRRKPFPGLLQGLLVFWMHQRAFPVLGYLFMGPLIRREWYALLPLGFLAVQMGSLLVAPLFAWSWGRRTLRDMLSLHAVPWRFWPGFLMASFGFSVLSICVLLTLIHRGHVVLPPEPVPSPGSNFIESPLVLVLGAACTEEFLFRGVFLKGFLRRYPRGLAILLGAVLFGWAHGNSVQFIGAGAFGLFVGWAFARTGSLWPGLVAHALNNGLPDAIEPLLSIQLGASVAVRAWMVALGCLAIGLSWMLWATRRDSAPAWRQAS